MTPSNLLMNQSIPESIGPVRVDELLKPPVVNRRKISFVIFFLVYQPIGF